MEPSDDPKADELINPNMPHPEMGSDPYATDPSMAEDPNAAADPNTTTDTAMATEQDVESDKMTEEEVGEFLDSITPEQRNVVTAMVLQAIEDAKKKQGGNNNG